MRSESYNVGERIRAMILEVKKQGPRVKVILSRAHRDLVRALFELEVPEIADGTIVIRRIEREPGYRSKVAVASYDPKVDAVGACVGVRGSRIKGSPFETASIPVYVPPPSEYAWRRTSMSPPAPSASSPLRNPVGT